MRRISLVGAIVFIASQASAATYYVDYQTGSDSNPGTSKSQPWKSAHGMASCSGTCASTTLNAGDSVILKGGVTWPNPSFMWSLAGGTAASPIYYGVDKTWYAGTSWSRPTLSAGAQVIANNSDTMFTVGPNVTVDNFEITGFYWTTAACSGAPYGDCGIFNCGQESGQTWENLYIHGWTHAGTDTSTSNGVINIWSTGGGGNSVAHDNVVVGTDVPGDHSVSVFFGGPPISYNNYIRQVSSGYIVNYATSIHDNHIEDIGPAYCNVPTLGSCTHENGFEDNADNGLYFYNNVITNVSAGLALWVAPNPGSTVYVFNNVIYAVHDNQVLDLALPVYTANDCSTGQNGVYCSTAGNYAVINNTVECGDDTTQTNSTCQSVGSSTGASFTFKNNHLIVESVGEGCAAGLSNCTFTSNVVQTLATANAQGYRSTDLYAFSPTSSSGATVGGGLNLGALATGPLAALAEDTTYGVMVAAGNAPAIARASNERPSSGSWNAGAYQFCMADCAGADAGVDASLPSEAGGDGAAPTADAAFGVDAGSGIVPGSRDAGCGCEMVGEDARDSTAALIGLVLLGTVRRRSKLRSRRSDGLRRWCSRSRSRP
jgi:hypothetical protein